MKTDAAIEHIFSVTDSDLKRYSCYLTSIIPVSQEDVFRRWLFTYASVHTQWVMNCRLYHALEDLCWLGNKSELLRRITESRAGMHNKRAEYIYAFSQFYWDHPDWFCKNNFETWPAYRKRMQAAAKGIGQAKAAFLVELTHPITADVICVDTHILQLYGYTTKEINERGISAKKMAAVEQHWVDAARTYGLPPVVARWVYWDRKQGQSDSRYWSFVFEEENYNDRLAQVANIAAG